MLQKPHVSSALVGVPALAGRPSSIAIIGTESPDTAFDSVAGGMADVTAFFADADAFLASPRCYEHGFMVVGGEFSLRDGVALVRLVRRRSSAGLVAWRTRAPAAAWLDAGADLWLPRSSTLQDLAAAVRAVQRRHPAGLLPSPVAQRAWRLEHATKRLHTPMGIVIPLADNDFEALAAFASAKGQTASFAALNKALGHEQAAADNVLHAAMYRLRRRIERATEEPFPLGSQAGVGYLFRADILEI